MRYDEFRDAFFSALREARLHPHVGRPTETIDLTTTTRRWEAERVNAVETLKGCI